MTSQRDRKKEISLYWNYTIQDCYSFTSSRIEDGVRHKFSCLISVSCICFLNKFLLTDFLIFSGKAFHSLTPKMNSFMAVKDEKT